MIEFVQQNILATLSIVIPTVLAALLAIFWKNFIKPLFIAVRDHSEIIESIRLIKAEMMPNGGESLKDQVGKLDKICQENGQYLAQITASQRVVEHRSKVALDDNHKAMFEVSKDGKFAWGNRGFYQITRCVDGGCNLDPEEFSGFSWVSVLISEKDRATFLKELKSCLSMVRTIEFETEYHDGKRLKLVGNPYKVSQDEHNGYLFSLFLFERT